MQQGGEVSVVLRKGEKKAVRRGIGERLRQQRLCLAVLAQHFVGRRRLNADVQRHQRVMHRPAHGQQPLAAPDDLGV